MGYEDCRARVAHPPETDLAHPIAVDPVAVPAEHSSDAQFPQMRTPDLTHKHWEPAFVDCLAPVLRSRTPPRTEV